MSERRVVLAMSGGVDSGAAAGLLLEQGYEVIGVFMRHGEQSSKACELGDGKPNPLLPILEGRLDHKQGCCSASDAADARRVADKLSIPYALDLEAEFKQIVDYFVDEYQQGRTPNPCVQCNNWIKFGRLFDYADAVDAYYVATGHYARMIQPESTSKQSEWELHRGLDDDKDQAYVLTGIKRHLLPRMLLPVGGFHKSQIRDRAAQMGLKVADKKDSQEICFVTSGKHAEFVRRKTAAQTPPEKSSLQMEKSWGTIRASRDLRSGSKGLGVAMGSPFYVTSVDRNTNRVVIGPHEELACKSLRAGKSNWLADFPIGEPTKAQVQFRYNSAPCDAIVTREFDGDFEVEFFEDVYGVSPGQLAAVFLGTRAMGCGWIA